MGGAVKKIAKVAAIGAAVYFGGGAIAGSMTGTTAAKFGSTAFWKGTATSSLGGFGSAFAGVSKLVSPTALSAGGAILQGASYLQQRKFAGAQASATRQAAEEQKRIAEAQQRYQQVQAKRQRLDILRQQRIQTGRMEAETGGSGLGLTGTSGFTGATSSIQTQTTANLGALDMSQGASQAISTMSQRAADYTTQAYTAKGMATQWSSIGSLGGLVSEKAPQIFSIFK